MRTLVLAMVAAMATAPVMAADLGNGLSLNTELKAFHKVDAETNHVTIEPELRWTPAAGPLALWAEAPITVYETNHTSGSDFALSNILEDGQTPLLEMGVDYSVSSAMTLYGETSYDFNTEARGEIEIGVSFNF